MTSDNQDPPVEQPKGDLENQVNDGAPTKPALPSSWWSKNKAVAISAAMIVVALVVGLSVGLTTRKNHRGSASAATTTTQSENKTTTTTAPPDSFASSTLPTFGQEALVPYTSCNAFISDLTAAVNRLINTTVESSILWRYHTNYSADWCPNCQRPVSAEGGDLGFAGGSSTSNNRPAAAPSSSSAEGVSSFGSNNQVAGVDEADVVKSDGVHVFAVYGSDIVVLDPTNTTLLSRTTIPTPNITTFFPDLNISAFNTNSTTASGGSSGSSGSSPGFAGGAVGEARPYYPTSNWNCYSSINSLLLTGDRLVVVAYQSCDVYLPGYTPRQSVLSDYGKTVVFVYDVSTVPTDGETPLTLISQTTLKGYYGAARSIDSVAYLVTNSYIDTWTLLSQLDVYYLEQTANRTLSESEYRAQVTAIAQRAVPDFISQLVGELKNATGATSCDNFLQLTLLQTSASGAADQHLSFAGGSGVLNTLTLVTSIDVSRATLGEELVKSTACMFQPTGGSVIYANAGRLFVAGQGYSQLLNGAWLEETYLMVFRFSGASIRAEAVGQVPGYTINQFSLDATRQNGVDYLRVATTSSAQWGLVDGFWNQTTQSTNQLFVLKLPADGAESRVLTVAGSINNISVSESIQSVRFFGDEAFISTFRIVDPFLTVDLSVPSAPKLVGELHVPGFSSYLQPIANGTQILAVGQNANETTGQSTGLQISLFDVSNFSNPTLLQAYTVPTNNTYGWSSSEAQYDHQAFRYLEKPKLLIIPVAVNDYYFNNSFDGFVVYNIDPTAGITPSFTIEHANNYDIRFGCWSSAYLQARSLVFSGDVLTLKGHTVENHNLDSHQQLGSVLDLDKNFNRSECSPYVF